MSFLKQIFTWWNSQTLGTRIFTFLNGTLVGQDVSGNLFYECKKTSRRWVIYKKHIDASYISAEWHGWLHHTFEFNPIEKPFKKSKWQKEHVPNLTGTRNSYHPHKNRKEVAVFKDYEPWFPESE